jgi:hypothetical protein
MFQLYCNLKSLNTCTSCTFYTWHEQRSYYRWENCAINSLSLAVGFKTGILFSLKVIHLYWNLFEVTPVIFMYCIILCIWLVKQKNWVHWFKNHGMDNFKMLIHLPYLHPIVLYDEVFNWNIRFACMLNVFLYCIIIYINIIIVITKYLTTKTCYDLHRSSSTYNCQWMVFCAYILLYSIWLYRCPAEHRTH